MSGKPGPAAGGSSAVSSAATHAAGGPAHVPAVAGAADVPDWVVHHPPADPKSTHPTKLCPFLRGPHEGGKNCWSEVEGKIFSLRSATYLTDAVKLPSADAPFRIIGITAFKTTRTIPHSAELVTELRDYLAAHRAHNFLVISWLLPGTAPAHAVVQVFVRQAGPDPTFDGLYQRFVDGDDEFRNSRFKFMCKIVHAPWLVSAAVSNLGGERPSILGKKLRVEYHRGANYLEIDVDVGSSKIASLVKGVFFKGAASIVTDLGFTLEGQAEDELPERIMACLRFHNCEFDQVAVDKTAIL